MQPPPTTQQPSAKTMNPTSLPILSLTSGNLPDELYQACRDHGFFYLTDHGIPKQTLDQVVELARQFFTEAPEEAKHAIQRRTLQEGGDGAHGYQRIGENITKGIRDWQEAVDYYAEWDGIYTAEGTDDGLLRGKNIWPEYPRKLQRVYEEYIELVKDVGTRIVKAMGESLGLEGDERDLFVEKTRESFWVMRMIGYPPLQAEEDGEGVSCGEHTGKFSSIIFLIFRVAAMGTKGR
jgi:isopenicillin N synthase-like dioxygenase